MTPPAALAPPAVLDALHHWAPIVWLRVHPYAYPTLETIHIVGLALVFGTLWVVDLAILGGLRGLDPRQLARRVLPWTLAGFLLAAASGLTMFATNVADLIAVDLPDLFAQIDDKMRGFIRERLSCSRWACCSPPAPTRPCCMPAAPSTPRREPPDCKRVYRS